MRLVGLKIPGVLLPVAFRLSVVSHKNGSSEKWNFAMTCKSEWMWAH